MKKRFVSLITAAVLLAALYSGPALAVGAYPGTLPTGQQVSDWALTEVEKADELGLIPNSFYREDLREPTTREEFAALAVLLYEQVTQQEVSPFSPNPFTDTDNADVLKAYALGITNGTTDTTFSPDAPVTREQCAAMLYRAIGQIVPEGTEISMDEVSPFPDQAMLSDWALDGARYLSGLGVIRGDEHGNFMPRPVTEDEARSGYGMTTREAAVVMGLRTYNVFQPIVSDDPPEIVYLCSSFLIQWCQDIAAELENLEQKLNFNLTCNSSSNDNERFVELVEIYSSQCVDGFILNATEDINNRLLEIAREAGIPVLFESSRIEDENNMPLTSGVELNAYDCGAGCSAWVAENHQDYGFDYSDQSKLGFITVTYSRFASLVTRAYGATETFQAYFPDANYYVADLVAQGESSAEAAFNEVAPILMAHPEMENWVIVGVLDDYARGATRAIEVAGLEDQTLVTSIGGETLVLEWDTGYEGCWVMCNYFNAQMYTSLLAPAICAVARRETTVRKLWPEWNVHGSDYSVVQITGVALTRDAYQTT